MSDWRKLPAGFDLDRLIAERLGWRIELRRIPAASFLPDDFEWYAVSPDGVAYYQGGELEYSYENDVWKRAFWAPEGSPDIPWYSTDANAELPVLAGAWFEATWASWHGEAHARVILSSSSRLRECDPPFERGETMALARARAWLAFQDRMAPSAESLEREKNEALRLSGAPI